MKEGKQEESNVLERNKRKMAIRRGQEVQRRPKRMVIRRTISVNWWNQKPDLDMNEWEVKKWKLKFACDRKKKTNQYVEGDKGNWTEGNFV